MRGLRHTLGTRLREVTSDLDLIRRILGQQTLSIIRRPLTLLVEHGGR